MPTGRTKIEFNTRQLLGKEDFETRFFNYLDYTSKEIVKALCVNDLVINGNFTITADGNDKFQINGDTSDVRGVTKDGNVFDITASPASTYMSGIDFANATGSPYYVGLEYVPIPTTLSINPRSGMPEWIEFTDTIGVTGTPDSIVDNGDGTLTANVNTICDNLDCSGRTVLIYQSTLESGALNTTIAKEELTVVWSSPNNTITTIAALGQASISTTASDYTVVLLGPTVQSTAAIKTQDGVVYVGLITGNGPAAAPVSFNHTDQNNAVSLSTVFSSGLAQDLLPSVDNTYDVGSSSKKWANLYVTNLNVTNLLPALHDTYDLGSNGTRWQDLYLSGNLYLGGSVASDLLPSITATNVLGSSSYKWKSLQVSSTLSSGHGCSSLIPLTDGVEILGDTGRAWNSINVNTAVVNSSLDVVTSATPGVGCDSLWPLIDGSGCDLGGSSKRWSTFYINIIDLDDSAGKGFSTNVVPDTNNSLDLGNTSYRWKDLYVRGISYTGKIDADPDTSLGASNAIEATGYLTGHGVVATGGATNGVGVVATGSGTAYGVSGTGGATNGIGVYGNGSGTGAGVYGLGGSGGGYGVWAVGANGGAGIYAAGNGAGQGVYGLGGATDATGVYGVGGTTNGNGVKGLGKGTGAGIYAMSTGNAAPLRIETTAGDPASPNEGDIWITGDTLHFYSGGATRTVTST